jgi:hypothetical protein
MRSIIGRCACCIFCIIQLNLYFMIDCIVTVFLSSISDDGFYIYVHRSSEDTLNMDMNMNNGSRDGSVDIVTGYGVDGQGFFPASARFLSIPVFRPALGPTPPPNQWV